MPCVPDIQNILRIDYLKDAIPKFEAELVSFYQFKIDVELHGGNAYACTPGKPNAAYELAQIEPKKLKQLGLNSFPDKNYSLWKNMIRAQCLYDEQIHKDLSDSIRGMDEDEIVEYLEKVKTWEKERLFDYNFSLKNFKKSAHELIFKVH
jgi:hypothetical protein